MTAREFRAERDRIHAFAARIRKLADVLESNHSDSEEIGERLQVTASVMERDSDDLRDYADYLAQCHPNLRVEDLEAS